MNVICIDDEKLILQGMERILSSIDLVKNLNCFTDYKKALEYVYNNDVDVAFVDINMPGVLGNTVAKNIIYNSPKTKIVYSTGYSEKIFMTSNCYILKPARKEDVEKILNNLDNIEIYKDDIFVKCFGEFNVYIKDKLFQFPTEESKEIFAYMIDKQLESYSFDIFKNQLGIKKPKKEIKLLQKIFGKELINIEHKTVSVAYSNITCDYYDWDAGRFFGLISFKKEYMSQYSWAIKTEEELLKPVLRE